MTTAPIAGLTFEESTHRGIAMDELDNYDLSQIPPADDITVGDVQECIETNLWLADAYFAQGAEGLARECIRAAWYEYRRYQDLLTAYGRQGLGEKLTRMMAERCNDLLRELAA